MDHQLHVKSFTVPGILLSGIYKYDTVIHCVKLEDMPGRDIQKNYQSKLLLG